MSRFDLLNNFRTSRSSFSKKPQRTEGFHKIISSFIEGYPTNSEIFWEVCLYMRISSQILRTIVVYEKLVIWIFANHGYIPENPPENRQLSFSISDSNPTLVKTCFHWDLFQESLKFHLNLWLTTDYMHRAHSWVILRISVAASKHYNSLPCTSVLIEAVQHLNFMTSRPHCHTEDASFQEFMRWVIEFQAFHWHTSSTYDICKDTNPARDLCKAKTWWALTCVFEKTLFLIADIKVGRRSWYLWQERGCQLLNSFAPLFCN
jgi:hypothetical protein